jgi:hypothetical protein
MWCRAWCRRQREGAALVEVAKAMTRQDRPGGRGHAVPAAGTGNDEGARGRIGRGSATAGLDHQPSQGQLADAEALFAAPGRWCRLISPSSQGGGAAHGLGPPGWRASLRAPNGRRCRVGAGEGQRLLVEAGG